MVSHIFVQMLMNALKGLINVIMDVAIQWEAMIALATPDICSIVMAILVMVGLYICSYVCAMDNGTLQL